MGQCKALFNFTPEQDDELTLKEGKWTLICRLSKTEEFINNLAK